MSIEERKDQIGAAPDNIGTAPVLQKMSDS